MKKIIILIILIAAGFFGYKYLHETGKTYTNELRGYKFTYPKTWEAVTSSYDAGNVLFGPGATSKTGHGGVELLGELKSGQTLADFVKESNAGAENGSISETPSMINKQPVIISISAGPGTREVKAVAFENNSRVFSVYLSYQPEEKTKLVSEFDTVLNSFSFIDDTPFVEQFPNLDKNGVSIAPQKNGTDITIKQYYLEKPGFIVIHAIEQDAPAAIVAKSELLPLGLGKDLKINTPLPAGTYFALLYWDDGDTLFDIQKDYILPLYSDTSKTYSEKFVAQFIVK